MSVLENLALPIVQAPMAGGPSTPALAAAVSRAGGLGFLAAGYLTAERLAQDISAACDLTDGPLGVNLFVGGAQVADRALVAAYARRLAAEAERAGVQLGEPRFDDDSLAAKLNVLTTHPVAVVSFTFGLPSQAAVEALQAAGSEVWLTVTSLEEAREAVALGVDALVVQGVEAGGHRGVFVDDDDASELTLLAALQLVGAAVDLPLVGAGAIMHGAALAAVLTAGAVAGQLGSAYLLSTEAGTAEAYRKAVEGAAPTVLTRAFSGRSARGIVNRWHRDHAAFAPRAYPEVHHLTQPLRAHGRQVGDAELINLWAGQAHQLAVAAGAEEITRRIAADARTALELAGRRLRR
jgi:nitronate monooxygenase